MDVNVAARVVPNALRPAIFRARNRVYPPVPGTLLNFGQILQQAQYQNLALSEDGNDNIFDGVVRSGNGQYTSIIFASRRMKRFMRRVKIIFCDGTFSSRPNVPNSAQVLQLSTVVGNHVSTMQWLPAFFILIPCQTKYYLFF